MDGVIKIVIADDHPLMRRGLRMRVEEDPGLNVVGEASDGEMALQLVTRHVPHVALLALAGVACVACFFSLADVVAALVVIRILLQFLLQHVGVMVLRRTRPELARPFRTPWVPFIPVAGIVVCLAMMVSLGIETWIRLVVWLAIGFAVYFFYSRPRTNRAVPQAAE